VPILLNAYQKQQGAIAAQQPLLEKHSVHIAVIFRRAMEIVGPEQQLKRDSALHTTMQERERLADARSVQGVLM
jgi:hypothetical protein